MPFLISCEITFEAGACPPSIFFCLVKIEDVMILTKYGSN